LDYTSILREQEVVRSLRLAEAHYVFAVMVHVMLGRAFRGFRRLSGWNLRRTILSPYFLQKERTRKC
jgi:hypothetical protein